MRGRLAYILGIIITLLISSPVQAAEPETEPQTQAEDQVSITLNDTALEFDDPIILEDARIFVPIRSFTDSFGGSVEWEPTVREVHITTELGDRLVFGIDNPVMKINEREYQMDVAPFIREQRTYVPIRHAAEFLHMDVSWDAEHRTAVLVTIPLHILAENDTIEGIVEVYDTTEDLLLERNEAESTSDIERGTPLKVVIPEIMKHKIEAPPEPEIVAVVEKVIDEDFQLLAKIVQVEAGYESYESQLAVANVVLNRMKAEPFPDSIREVIYAPGQFPPAHNGLLDAAKPGENALKAAEAALSGENNVEGALYFYNPAVTSGPFWESLRLIKEIGNHRYVGP
jgi:N-acetylmuramoyl-L-alanine amidase